MRELPLPTLPIQDLGPRDLRAQRRSLRRSEASAANATRLVVAWARDAAEVREAQQLRHQVFADEMVRG